MYCSNGSGMATLLQQKNCMKTLTNGGVSGGGNNSSNNATTSIQQTRVLLPHEMVGLPSSVVSSTGSSSSNNNVSTSSVGAFVVTQHTSHNQQLIQQQQPQQNNQDSTQNFSHNQFNNQVNHVQFSRYFSQFNNQDSNVIYMSSASSSSTTTSVAGSNAKNNIPSTSSQHVLITNTSSNTTTLGSGSIPSTMHTQQYHQSQPHHQTTCNTATTTISSSQYQNSQSHHLENSTTDDGCKNQIDNCANNCDQPSQGDNLANGIQMADDEPEPEIDIVINNVVCSFSVRCHLNLREIALKGFNVEFRRENGMVTMKLRRPYTTASIWSSGRITCTGATSEDQAKIAARRYARCLQKLGFNVKFNNFRVVNVLGTCSMPWAIKIVNFSEKYKKEASYEPELHPGVTYKLRYPKATLKIFSTGSITVTAGSVAYVQAAIEHIFPLVYEFRKKRTPEDLELLRSKNASTEKVVCDDEIHSPSAKRKRPLGYADNDPTEDIMYVSETEEYEMEENV